MVIQNLVFPDLKVCTVERMYYKTLFGTCRFSYEDNFLIIYPHTRMTFDSYFNIFSISKYVKYTNNKNYKWTIHYKGKMKLTLIRQAYVNYRFVEEKISEIIADNTDKADITIDIPFVEEENTLYYLIIETFDKEVIIYSGEITSDNNSEEAEVKIALNICTRHREDFIDNTINILKKEILTQNKSPLNGHLVVFITDNGQTLDPQKYNNENIIITLQDGYGSAGGYTRGLIEILRRKDEFGITHFIFTDDDIVYHTETLFRTYTLLKTIKKEYSETMIGGAIFRLDYPYIQHEAGALWNRGKICGLKAGYDMTNEISVINNEIIEESDFSGWWYCCVPLELEKKIGLPAPVYFHRDDVEYGLRSKNQIYLNGICVWHEPFDNKPGAHIKYYDNRNYAIVNSWHLNDFKYKEFIKFYAKNFLKEILEYRYVDAKMILLALKDWGKGVDGLIKENTSKKFDELYNMNYKVTHVNNSKKFLDYIGFLNNIPNIPETKKRKYWRYLTFNGLFLTPNHNITVPMYETYAKIFYRAKTVINYNPVNETVYVTKRNYKETIKLLFSFLYLCIKIKFNFKSIVKQWKNSEKELKGINSWKKMLDCD